MRPKEIPNKKKKLKRKQKKPAIYLGFFCRYRGTDYVQQKKKYNQTIKHPGEVYCLVPLIPLRWWYLHKEPIILQYIKNKCPLNPCFSPKLITYSSTSLGMLYFFTPSASYGENAQIITWYRLLLDKKNRNHPVSHTAATMTEKKTSFIVSILFYAFFN